MTYEAVLFDCDGVLVELTELAVLHEAIRTAFRDCGVTAPDDADVSRCLGATAEDVHAVCDEYGLDPDAFWRRREANAVAAQLGAFDRGTKRQFDDAAVLTSLPHPVGVVSNNQHRTVTGAMERLEFSSVLATCYGREPTIAALDRQKPAPYYLERAMDDLGTDQVLYVGDSTVDIEAAANADIDVVHLRRPGRSVHDFDNRPTTAEPTATIETLADLPELLGTAVAR